MNEPPAAYSDEGGSTDIAPIAVTPDDNSAAYTGIGCTCEWDVDGNPIGGHKPPCRMASAARSRP